jgi:tRNA nucleotidyltransferase (CCA-adding enzyme)
MDLIVGHMNLDFDCLAAMAAVKKLFPAGVIAVSGKMQPNVAGFASLHKDVLSLKKMHQIDFSRVERLFVVDTNSWKRTGIPLEKVKNARVIVYDHHERAEDAIPAYDGIIKEVGAATSILVRELQKKKIKITPFEATLMLLGIYSDTGSLTYPSTKEEDALAVAYLLKHRANLHIVNDYLESAMLPEQQKVFNSLNANSRIYSLKGRAILISRLQSDTFVNGLAIAVYKLMQISNVDGIFIIAEMEGKTHIIARSRTPAVNVAAIVEKFGGGGHPGAASAIIKGAANRIEEEIIEMIGQSVTPQPVVREIMSKPVRTVSPGTSVETASSILFRYGHTGLPVVEGDKLLGIISRRDLEKAVHHGLGHAPVKGFMSKNVVTVDANEPLSSIRKLLVENDVGRLPVLENGRLIGIVTRTDVLALLHGDDFSDFAWDKYLIKKKNKDIPSLIRERLTGEQYDLLVKVGRKADEAGVKAYVVGGFVRDLLLGQINFDVDIVVEGDGIEFARQLVGCMGGELKIFDDFKTARISLGQNHLDIVSARREFYPEPAALPEVENSTLLGDLVRRDFSINAMAIGLNEKHFGVLIDPFGGEMDLERKQIRVMHNLSFIEDPTRILRGIRFKQRFCFNFEEETESFLMEAVRLKVIEKVSKERWMEEFCLLLKEGMPLDELAKYGLLKAMHGDWITPSLPGAESSFEIIYPIVRKHGNVEIWQMRMLYLISSCSEETIREIALMYKLPKNIRDKMLRFPQLRKTMEILASENSGSGIYNLLQKFSLEEVAVCWIMADRNGKEKICFYLKELLERRVSLGGEDLKAMGVEPGPKMGKILTKLLQEKLDGKISSPEQERKFVIELLNSEKGEK